MNKVYVLTEKYKGRSFCITASTNPGVVLLKALELVIKAEIDGKLAPILSPFVEGDLTEEERNKRDYEYSIEVFEVKEGRPLMSIRVLKDLTVNKMLAWLEKTKPLPHYR